MFTQNYINLKKALFEVGANTSYTIQFTKVAGDKLTFVTTSNVQAGELGYHLKNGVCGNLSEIGYSNTSFNVMCGVFFGSGSTPATKNDYKLESPITSGLSIASPNSLSWDNSIEGRYICSASFTIQNTTDADINIYEIGLFTPILSTSSSYYSVLMERTVLTEPITITAGGTRIVNYKLTFNQTLNVE